MKKNVILSALLALTMIFCMAAAVSASDAKMTAIYGTPKIDGELDDIWKNAEVQDVALVDDEVIPSETKTRGTVRTMWDEKYFYVFVEVDKKGVEISAGGGKNENSDDCADVCITLDGNFSASLTGGDEYAGVYRVIEDGTSSGFGYVYDYLGDDNIGAFKRVADDKYNVEYAISWDDIEAKAGNTVSLEIQINDCTDGARTGLVTWASTPCYGWRESNEHGTVTLGAKEDTAPAEEAKTEEPAETVETPAAEPAETVETPAAEPAETVDTPAEEAPQTFDAVVIAAVAAAVSLAGYAVSKKR